MNDSVFFRRNRVRRSVRLENDSVVDYLDVVRTSDVVDLEFARIGLERRFFLADGRLDPSLFLKIFSFLFLSRVLSPQHAQSIGFLPTLCMEIVVGVPTDDRETTKTKRKRKPPFPEVFFQNRTTLSGVPSYGMKHVASNMPSFCLSQIFASSFQYISRMVLYGSPSFSITCRKKYLE